jgi:hypothetical protein
MSFGNTIVMSLGTVTFGSAGFGGIFILLIWSCNVVIFNSIFSVVTGALLTGLPPNSKNSAIALCLSVP